MTMYPTLVVILLLTIGWLLTLDMKVRKLGRQLDALKILGAFRPPSLAGWKSPPDFIRPGADVWFTDGNALRMKARVISSPFLFADVLVVRLRCLDKGAQEITVACDELEPRHETEMATP